MDRLSSLPDSLICHILSFLPTKCAVATSLLRRRWRSLWTDVPSLHFDECDYYKIVSGEEGMRFEDIINRVLSLHTAGHLNNFFFSCEDLRINEHQLDAWMSAVVSRSVRNIEISLFGESSDVPLPPCLFTCKTLVDLKLRDVTVPAADCVVRLPCLKKLHLDCIENEDEGWLSWLLSGCIALEDLVLERGYCFNGDIHSLTLKRLRLISVWVDPPVNYGGRVNINTPALQYLEVDENMCERFSAGTLSNLVKAHIQLLDRKVKKSDVDGYCLMVIELVNRVHNVKFLKLKSQLPIFDYVSSVTARFDNLTTLDLRADWFFLLEILELADNLEHVIIRKVRHELKYWEEPDQVPKCMLSHLATVSIDGVEWEEVELEMVRYILWNAKVLEMVKIYSVYPPVLGEQKMLEKISSFPRGSEKCELAFCWGCHN